MHHFLLPFSPSHILPKASFCCLRLRLLFYCYYMQKVFTYKFLYVAVASSVCIVFACIFSGMAVWFYIIKGCGSLGKTTSHSQHSLVACSSLSRVKVLGILDVSINRNTSSPWRCSCLNSHQLSCGFLVIVTLVDVMI